MDGEPLTREQLVQILDGPPRSCPVLFDVCQGLDAGAAERISTWLDWLGVRHEVVEHG